LQCDISWFSLSLSAKSVVENKNQKLVFMKRIFLVFVALIFTTELISQDVIYKMNGQEIEAKVLEVLPEIVKYKVYKSQDGPVYSLRKSDIIMIKYEDGRKDVFIDNNTAIEKEDDNVINTFTDTRDNQKYKLVKIGNQTWMAENLNFSMDGAWCYDEKQEYCDKYGKLYTWDAAQKACPDGWRLPSDEEWKDLEVELGMQNDVDDKGWRGHSPGQGYKLKKGGGSGFDVELAGFGYVRSSAYGYKVGNDAYLWTSTERIKSKKKAWYRKFTKRASVYRDYMPKTYIMSIRCIKD